MSWSTYCWIWGSISKPSLTFWCKSSTSKFYVNAKIYMITAILLWSPLVTKWIVSWLVECSFGRSEISKNFSSNRCSKSLQIDPKSPFISSCSRIDLTVLIWRIVCSVCYSNNNFNLPKFIIWHVFAPVMIQCVKDLFDLIWSVLCSTYALENFHCNVCFFARFSLQRLGHACI